MKKILCYAALAVSCALMSGCVEAHAEDPKPRKSYINEDITVKSGYYISDEDDSYIRVDGNMIEVCNFDYENYIEGLWSQSMEQWDEQEREKQASRHDIVLENTTKSMKEQHSFQEYTIYTFPHSDKDTTMLVVNFEFAKAHDTYTGYIYDPETETICESYTYQYIGEELPEKAD